MEWEAKPKERRALMIMYRLTMVALWATTDHLGRVVRYPRRGTPDEHQMKAVVGKGKG